MWNEALQSVLSTITLKLDALKSQLQQIEKIDNMHYVIEETYGSIHPDKVDRYYEIMGSQKPDFAEQRSKIESDIKFLSDFKRRMENKFKDMLKADVPPEDEE